MLNIVLFEPEIPPNTGNIIRLCANTGFALHLIEPLGFVMDDKKLRRAGLDYRETQRVLVHNNWQSFVDDAKPQRVFAISTKGQSSYCDVSFIAGDTLVFGPETRGLEPNFLASFFDSSIADSSVLRIPMQPDNRSLNLSNAVAIVAYEAWRQLNFSGAR